jgi:hypothetical protein
VSASATAWTSQPPAGLRLDQRRRGHDEQARAREAVYQVAAGRLCISDDSVQD